MFFNGDVFGSKLHFEAFAKHALNPRFVGYQEVKYQQRFAGSSNHTLGIKLKILFRYSIEYYKNPAPRIAMWSYSFFMLLILLEVFLLRGAKNGLLNFLIGLNLLTVLLIILHYATQIYRGVKQIPDYWIIESI